MINNLSLLTITNNIDTCNKYLFAKNSDTFEEHIIVITDPKQNVSKINSKFKVYYYEWDDNFSNALNFGITKCTKDWILRLDSDEYIEPLEPNIKILSNKLNIEHNDYYLMMIYNFYDDPYEFTKQNKNARCNIGYLPRLWRNNLGVKYTGIIHEQNWDSIQMKELKGGLIKEFGIMHLGTLINNDRNAVLKKAKYYHRLCEEQLIITPLNSRYHEVMFDYFFYMGHYTKALAWIDIACNNASLEQLPTYLEKRELALNKLYRTAKNTD